MLRVTLLALGASLAIGSVSANEAFAQSGRDRAADAPRTTDRRGDVVIHERRDRDWDRDSDRDSDRRGKYKNKNSRSKGNGPKFCRNGEGHPVYGMEWCRRKGYDTGYGVFSRVDWGDVVLRRPRDGARQRDLGRGTLQDILGSVVLGRFDRQRSRLGFSQPLYGRWVDSNDGAVL